MVNGILFSTAMLLDSNEIIILKSFTEVKNIPKCGFKDASFILNNMMWLIIFQLSMCASLVWLIEI